MPLAWTELTCPQYVRTGGRYASDTTDMEWAPTAPFLPATKRVGRPRTTDLRDVFDAILYIATTGCQWRMLPNDFPQVSTVRRYFYDWRSSSLLREMNHHLVAAARQAERRSASPATARQCFACKAREWAGMIPSRRMLRIQLPGNGQPERQNH